MTRTITATEIPTQEQLPSVLTTIYLAGSSTALTVSSHLKEILEGALPCQVLLPQNFLPPDSTEGLDRQHVFRVCKTMIDRSQIVLINMVRYGRDTSAEIGYGFAMGKTLIGYSPGGEVNNDCIVSGFTHHIVSSEVQLLQVFRRLLNYI